MAAEATDGTERDFSHSAMAAPWRRLVARSIDYLLVFFVLFALVISQIFWFMDELSDRFQPEPWGRGFVASVTYTVLYFLYEAWMVARNGQTAGKAALDVRVEPAEGETPGYLAAAVRALLPALAVGLLTGAYPLAMVLVMTVLFAPVLVVGRGIPDYLVGTRVMEREETEEEREEREAVELRLRRLRPKHRTTVGSPEDPEAPAS